MKDIMKDKIKLKKIILNGLIISAISPIIYITTSVILFLLMEKKIKMKI
ncbi:hypothetical protein [Mesomycoplasma lagogenitalium]|uniref:Uncharacterized protein n=1 Tax=Mesomycoplasma lagogenitalium TaxID=171286 RepID=A0ABY8LW53_9BACT|nr:hypothetical protein [Mesomycoplasma lagogenitalium]WGI36357.1 hypothetical protein QEG99_02660 [Mesomycoplasma lagogenitalium]